MADYIEVSLITVYIKPTGDKSVYEGLSGVEACFEGLFATLFGASVLGAPIACVMM